MPTLTSKLSLTRRLVDNYLMFGLACVFACMALAIPIAGGGPKGGLVALAVIVALLLLLFGDFVLRRMSRLSDAIEQQLRGVTNTSDTAVAALRPLRHADPVARGWNSLLQRLEDQRVMESLEDRLKSTLGSSDSQRWESAFNSLSDGVAVTDGAGMVETANNALLALLGKSRDQTAAQPITALLAEATGADVKKLPPGLTASAGKFSCELRKGTEIIAGVWRVSRMPLIQDGAATGGGLVWTVRDVTQQKLAEDMRNQFVFTATHELRTPLANIRAYAETLTMDDEIDVESQKGFINIINAEASRLARFIDELLDVSQMEAGAINVARHETDIQRLLLEVVENVQPQVQKKELKFESVLPPKLPKLKLDKDKFTAAMVNLLGNAVKYTMQGGQVRLLVEVDASHIHFHVEDTGIGIAPDELRRMGEKFFRSQDARIRDIPGSGLGVAFAQEVARLHGGQLTVLSELDRGSRFSISLPLSSTERM